jgi:tRNA modification GTPase
LRDPRDDSTIDEAMVTYFAAPRSFTGEDIVEFSCHGGAAISTILLDALLSAGARAAAPGEFTARAVLNGKIDLLQAEAIGDLIDAQTRRSHAIALGQLDGGLSRLITGLRESILTIEALLSYDIDFPEEDDGPIDTDRIMHAVHEVIHALTSLLEGSSVHEAIRDGARVVIAGPPNAGKSSLLNALVGQRRALVSEVPGTTRDAIEVRVETPAWPLLLVDTAGLRDSADPIETMGVEVSHERIRSAHLVLLCDEVLEGLQISKQRFQHMYSVPTIGVLTKSDLRGDLSGDLPSTIVEVSALHRTGLDALIRTINETLDQSLGTLPVDAPILTRTRHHQAITVAMTELQQFASVWKEQTLPPTVAAVHVRAASEALGELIGAIDVDAILERVFRTFCVGK